MRAGAGLPVLPLSLVLLAMCSFQLGGSLAKGLFGNVGPQGASALRLVLSALVLGAVWRPWRGRLGGRAIRAVLAYGAALAGLNLFFYLAVQTIPLGVAVAVDFLGPLGVAVAFSRRWLDALWVAVAVLGIALLLPLGGTVAALDPVGLLYCLGGAVSWAAYILFGRAASNLLPSGRATALGVTVGAVLILPLGVARAGAGLLDPPVLLLGLVVAVLSSALPNSLEMVALNRLPLRVFGVLMSLEPALAALFGWLVLGERLTLRQDVAIACVMLAAAGATLTASRVTPPLDG